MSTVYCGSIVISCPPADVVAFMKVPENQMLWSTFVRSTRPLGNGRHEMTTMFGDAVAYRLDCDEATGVVDICMETPVGVSCMPTRATPHSKGSFFTFGIIRPPAISDDDWARSCAGLDHELGRLKHVIEEGVAVRAA
jgi:hypothetical protein